MEKIELIVSDIDGTLIDRTETISEEFKAVLRKCEREGIVFALNSGRTYELVQSIVSDMGISFPYILGNGAAIYQDGKCIASHMFSVASILDVIRYADDIGLTVTFADEYSEKGLRCTPYIEKHQEFGGRYNEFIDIESFDWNRECFIKVMFHDQEHSGRIKEIQQRLSPFSNMFWITSYASSAVELSARNVNKATGMQELAKLLNVPLEHVMACGDYKNDLEMIEHAGIGVAVGNACEEIKRIADYVAAGNYSQGVIEAMEAYCFQ